MDRIFGPGYRRTEVRAAFAAQLLPLPNGIARLYEQVASASSDNLDRFMHLGLVLLVVALAMMLAAWSRQRGASGSARWPRSATSAGALAFILPMMMSPGAAQDLPRADSDDEIQLTGQPAIEIFVSSERQFFHKAVNAQLTFEANDEGRVLAVVLHQNGVDQRARRID
jgi:hypothetical protein